MPTLVRTYYDDKININNNWDGGRPQLFNAQETRVIVGAVRKDSRIKDDISKDKKLNFYL